MPNGTNKEFISREEARWKNKTRSEKECRSRFTTPPGTPVITLYTPASVAPIDPSQESSFPGEYPFMRGIHASGYWGRLWIIRQFSGFGSAQETSQRFKYVLANGQTGLSVAFDPPIPWATILTILVSKAA